MKDPSISRLSKRPKLKLLVSFNGAFCRRLPSGKFRYIGGETRIISVERNITFSKLKAKIADLFRPDSNVSEFSLKYLVSESFCGGNGDEETPLLIILESDDDVRCMVEEYEMMQLKGMLRTRLWIFVCNVNDDSGFVNKHVLNVEGDGLYEGKKGFVENMRDDEGMLSEDLIVLLGETDNKSKKLNNYGSLRKIVLKQQLLAKKLDEIRSFRGGVEQSEMELTSENRDSEPQVNSLCSEPESPSSLESKNLDFDDDLYRRVTDYKYLNAHKMANENFGRVLPVTESNSRPLSPHDGNLCLGSSGQSHMILGNGNSYSLESPSLFVAPGRPSKLSYNSIESSMVNGFDANCDFRSVERATLSDMNRENIMPWGGKSNMVTTGYFGHSGSNQLTGSMYSLRSSQRCQRGQERCQGDIRNHRFGFNEARSQRNCPYHVRSRSLVTEMGRNRNFKLDGRHWIDKLYPRLRSDSNISKQGPVVRTYCGQENLIKTGLHRVLKHERANPGEGHIAYHGANDKSPLPSDTAASSSPNTRAVDANIDLLTGPGIERLDMVCQAVSAEDLKVVGMDARIPLDISPGVHLSNQEEVISCSTSNILCYSSGTELGCNSKLRDTELRHGSIINHSYARLLDGHTASPPDLSLHNLSLSSSRKLQPMAPSCAKIDNSQRSLKPRSKDLNLMDEEHLNSGPKVEISSDVATNFCLDNEGKNNDDKQEIQKDPEEKDENKKTNKCLKVNGGNPADIDAFYTHLATRELQSIRNSDLECIKELGSGAYGTVYHGKWKGSDVAIKRIKPSCFTDGAKEEDRLIADFWKEAHILGQLHHPNIVALYGVVTDGPANSLATVTEYMINGSLKQVLRKKDRTIDRRKRLIIAMDAAFGMEYLHEKNIIHFDLKSHNFLMNMRDPQRPICKIGDLGLSKIKQRTLVSGGLRGTIPWMAPELLNGKDLVSDKVDVYSFAIVMWELLTGEEPYANMRSEEIIAGIIRGNLRPEIPIWCDPAWRSLIERCWSSDPDSRPCFSEIATELRAMAATMNIK